MSDPGSLRFSQTHEWARQQGDTVTVGITEYAQSQLGDVIYLELPSKGKQLDVGGKFGVIESVKAASDLFSPVGGEVLEVNEELKQHPEYINEDPYGKGWILKLRSAKDNPQLLDKQAYDAFVLGEAH